MSAREQARKIERLFAHLLTNEHGMALCDVIEQAIEEGAKAARSNAFAEAVEVADRSLLTFPRPSVTGDAIRTRGAS